MSRCLSILPIAGLVFVVGCARSPEERKARHLGRGDQYFESADYHAAIIEYRNAVRIDPRNPHAIRHLGFAHFQLGELGQSHRFLLLAKQLEPNDSATRVRLASIHLVRRNFEEARDEVNFVLEKDPDNFEALLVFAAATRSPEEIQAAIQRLERAKGKFGARAKFHLSLGNLYFRRKYVAAAAAAFREAVAKEPYSAEAHGVLGGFHSAQGNLKLAEQEFKKAAELAPVGSQAGVRLADFYLVLGKRDAARKILEEITRNAPDFLPAWRRSAEVALAEERHDEALESIEVVLQKKPQDVAGRLLKGRLLLARKNAIDAIQEFRRVLKAEPDRAVARFHLATALLEQGNAQEARAQLKEAAASAPNFSPARLLLAKLNLRAGAFQPVIEDMQALISGRPGLAEAYYLLGPALVATREIDRAVEAFKRLREVSPEDARAALYLGRALRAKGDLAGSRKQFEAALALHPDFVEPLAEIVEMDLAAKASEAALERVGRQIGTAPGSGRLFTLLGGVHVARGEGREAEEAYRKAIEVEPGFLAPYKSLARLYGRTGRFGEALERLDQAKAKQPDAVFPHMMTGILHQARGDIPKARAAYERVMELSPRFAHAANNLAYLYSEHGGDQDRALELAQIAKAEQPEDPRIADTLGWILYKRGVYERCLAFLEESATQLTEDAEVQYHLGMVHAKLARTEDARKALKRALELRSEFRGAEEARRTLAELE